MDATPTTTRSGGVSLLAALLLAAVLVPATAARAAAPTDLLISEYVEGSGFNKAVEFHNGTADPVDLSGYELFVSFNGGSTTATFPLSGTLAAGDSYVFADEDLAAYADQTTSANLWNGDDFLALRTTDGTVVDSFGTLGVDPGSNWSPSTQDHTLRRMASVCTGDTVVDDAFDPSLEWVEFPLNTFDGLGSHTLDCDGDGGNGSDAVINEFSASTTGTDVEYLEVYGPPDTDLSDLTVLQVEGDASSSARGTAVTSTDVGTTDGAGFWLGDLAANTLQNGTLTLLLVQEWDGTTVLDADQDGTIDATGFGTVVDGVAVDDGGTGDLTYDPSVLGPNYDGVSSFAPGGASRIPDGTDTDSPADWVRNDFDLAGIDGQAGSPEVGEAYNTPGAPNAVVEDTSGEIGACGDPALAIGTVQGDGATTPVPGDLVEIEGVVVGDFQYDDEGFGNLGGFHVQDAGDGDAATSDGIFVFEGSPIVDVSVGDRVRVLGEAAEYETSGGASSQTQVYADAVVVCDTGTDLPAPTEVTLPMTDEQWEALEGMYLAFPQDLAIIEYFNYDRFGEVVLATDRQYQPTAVFEPGSPEAIALAEANALNRITLDDGLSSQNPQVTRHPNGDPFTLDNRFRGGDLVTNTVGVLDESFGLYRVQPTGPADFTVANPRPDVPEVGGRLQVAAFNVLNYFPTLDDGTNDICGPQMDQECRGADTPEEFARQEAKIVAALAAMDADVVGLMEIENSPTAAETLVAALNAEVGAGTYAAIETGYLGSDAIKVALIYKPGTVTPVGDYATLTEADDPRFLDDKNRPALAQTFREDVSGDVFTVAVNHLKSKGSACDDVGDPEDPDGQGNCNGVRTQAAAALVDWMAGDPTGTGATDQLIIGDLNSYDKEDPIQLLVDAGWTDLLAQEQGEFAYTYVFDGQLGYLDHALANPAILDEVTGAAAWHANTDEPDLIDYDMSFKSDGQDAIYAPDPYRASDHDAVLVGLDLDDVIAPTLEVSVDPSVIHQVNHKYVEVTATPVADDNLDDDVEVRLVSVTSNEPDNGRGDGNTIDDVVVLSDTEFLVRAERSGTGSGRVYTFTWEAIDDAGNTTTATATVTIPK